MTKKQVNYSLTIDLDRQRRMKMKRKIGNFKQWVSASRWRKVAAGTLSTFLVAGLAFATYLVITTGSGQVTGSTGSQPSQSITVTATFNAIAVPGPVPVNHDCSGTVQNCSDLSFVATNTNAVPAYVKTLTVLASSFHSTNSACNSIIQGDLSLTNPDFYVGWPANSANGSQIDGRDTGDVYTLADQVEVPAGASNMLVNNGGPDAGNTGDNGIHNGFGFGGVSPNVVWVNQSNVDQTPCFNSTITATVTTTG